jgi:hypothetical protein
MMKFHFVLVVDNAMAVILHDFFSFNGKYTRDSFIFLSREREGRILVENGFILVFFGLKMHCSLF